jgi:HEAT repeat protein
MIPDKLEKMTDKLPNIPQLKQALESDDSSVRFNAGLDLVKAGDKAGIPALIETFNHNSSALRIFFAGQALVEMGEPAAPFLLDTLQTGTLRQRVAAAATLVRMDKTHLDRVFPIFVEGLQSDDDEAAYDAMQSLGSAGHAARLVVPSLLAELCAPCEMKDHQAWTQNKRVLIGALLANIGEPRAEIVAELIQNLKDAEPAVRWGAAVALGEMADRAAEAIPALTTILSDEEEVETIRVEAAYALAVIADPDQVTVPALLKAIKSSEDWVRVFAARILGEVSSPPAESEEATEFDWLTRVYFARRNVRRAVDPAPIVSALIPLLNDPVYDVRRNAAFALSLIGERATEAIPALIHGLTREDTGAVYAEALVKIGSSATARLEEALSRLDTMGRCHAGYALQKLGVEIDPALPIFKPEPRHFYIHFNVQLTEVKCRAFEALHERSRGKQVEYDLPYPKVEFMRYLVEKKGLYMHGTSVMDLEVLKPLRFSIDGADSGNVSGVYADLGYIRPIYFAVVHRSRCFGLSNGFFDLDEDGNEVENGERGFDRRYYKLAIGVNGMNRNPWREGMVYALPPDTFEYWNEWTSRTPVKPILRIPVSPEDLPVEVWGSDWRQAGNNFVQLGDPFPFLSDTKYTPVRLSGKPPWMNS